MTRTHAFTEGTAPTKSGGSTAPAPPRTTVQSVNWKLWQTWETECCPPSHHVRPLPQLRWPRLHGGAWPIDRHHSTFSDLCCRIHSNSPLHTSLSEITECPTEGPTACHQLCTASKHTFTCSCMPGFKLHTDGRSCQPEGLTPPLL